MALFADNVALCDITESLVFSDPYYDAKLNRHTSPQLDGIVKELRTDRDLKVAAQSAGVEERDGISVHRWKLRMGEAWSLPCVELARAGAKSASRSRVRV